MSTNDQINDFRARIDAIRLHASWALPAGSIALLIALIFENQPEKDWQDSLGRIAFIGSMTALAMFANRILTSPSPTLSSLSPSLPKLSTGFVRFSAIAGPTVLALLAASGWYFSSLQLANNIPATNWLIVLLVVADRLILR